jgi:indole-3-glycerol phosphate synthase
MKESGFSCFLVGESLMRSGNLEAKVGELIGL